MPEVTIEALVEAGVLRFGDGYRTKRSEHGEPGYRILRVADVDDGVVRLDGTDFVRKEFAPTIGQKISQGGDVLLTTKGTVGRVAIYPMHAEQCVYSPQLCFFRVIDEGVLHARFLAYWFKSADFTRQALHRANNTDMAPYINLRDIASLTISLPNIDDQRAIAEVLGALDDKIAANARLGQLIDQVLQATFALLADGRGSVELREVAQVNVAQTKPQPGETLLYLDISAVGQGRYDMPRASSWENAPGRARRVVCEGDTVWSTVRPNRRSHALILDPDPRLVASTGLAVLSPRPHRVAGVYEASRTEDFVAYLESVAEGSAYPAVRAERFESAPIPELDAGEWDAFEADALPLRRRGHAAICESRTLAALRDELLPLLMSSKLRVQDTEKVMEGVA